MNCEQFTFNKRINQSLRSLGTTERRLPCFARYCSLRIFANFTKHGIDFVEAQKLWNDSMLLEIPAKTEDEPRYIVIGLIGVKHWTAVITYWNKNIRIISVRRARKSEVAIYES